MRRVGGAGGGHADRGGEDESSETVGVGASAEPEVDTSGDEAGGVEVAGDHGAERAKAGARVPSDERPGGVDSVGAGAGLQRAERGLDVLDMAGELAVVDRVVGVGRDVAGVHAGGGDGDAGGEHVVAKLRVDRGGVGRQEVVELHEQEDGPTAGGGACRRGPESEPLPGFRSVADVNVARGGRYHFPRGQRGPGAGVGEHRGERRRHGRAVGGDVALDRHGLFGGAVPLGGAPRGDGVEEVRERPSAGRVVPYVNGREVFLRRDVAAGERAEGAERDAVGGDGGGGAGDADDSARARAEAHLERDGAGGNGHLESGRVVRRPLVGGDGADRVSVGVDDGDSEHAAVIVRRVPRPKRVAAVPIDHQSPTAGGAFHRPHKPVVL